MPSPSELTGRDASTTASSKASSQVLLPLKGIIVPMVTPLRELDALDIAGLELLIEHILDGGAHGLFILGTTGEGPSLSYRLRLELIGRVCHQVGGRVPILVGIIDTAFVESVRLARVAAESGASAVVAAPPYCFPIDQVDLLKYIKHLVSEVPLPLFLYNIPSHAKTGFELETVRQAAELPNVLGIKDSSSNMIYFHRLVSLFVDRPDFAVLVGPEELLGESLLLGGHGGVTGGANLYPQLYVQLYEAARNRDLACLAALHRQVMGISTGIYSVGQSESSYLRGLKCVLSVIGICDDFMAEPLQQFKSAERMQILQHLQNLGLFDKLKGLVCRTHD